MGKLTLSTVLTIGLIAAVPLAGCSKTDTAPKAADAAKVVTMTDQSMASKDLFRP